MITVEFYGIVKSWPMYCSTCIMFHNRGKKLFFLKKDLTFSRYNVQGLITVSEGAVNQNPVKLYTDHIFFLKVGPQGKPGYKRSLLLNRDSGLSIFDD